MTKNDNISLRDIYEISERLENKLDARMKDTEKRIDLLESFQNKVMGMALVISITIGTIGSWFWQKIVKN